MSTLIGPTVEETLAHQIRDWRWRLDFVYWNPGTEAATQEVSLVMEDMQEFIDALLHPIHGDVNDGA